MKKQLNLPAPLIPEYIDPYSDFGFKHYFGNKDLLIDFLNSIFKGHKVIRSLEYGNLEHRGPKYAYRKTLFDLYCTGENGEKFIVEMQKAKPLYFKDRSIFYTAALIQEQGVSVKSGWDYLLTEVYLVAVMDFCFDDTPKDRYFHHIMLMDTYTKKPFYSRLAYIFIEMPKFRKRIHELKTLQDKWLFMLNNLNAMDQIPVSLMNREEFVKLYTIAKIGRLNQNEMTEYQRRLKVERDNFSIGEAYKLEGKLEGRLEGKSEGRLEGKLEGRLEGKIEIASKLKAEGMAITKIAQITGFSVSKISDL